jgi:hypothetical protein
MRGRRRLHPAAPRWRVALICRLCRRPAPRPVAGSVTNCFHQPSGPRPGMFPCFLSLHPLDAAFDADTRARQRFFFGFHPAVRLYPGSSCKSGRCDQYRSRHHAASSTLNTSTHRKSSALRLHHGLSCAFYTVSRNGNLESALHPFIPSNVVQEHHSPHDIANPIAKAQTFHRVQLPCLHSYTRHFFRLLRGVSNVCSSRYRGFSSSPSSSQLQRPSY